MKPRNIFRMGTMLIGFAVVLLLGASARAQEIENTNWDDGPGAVPFAQLAPNRAVGDFNVMAKNSDAGAVAGTIASPVVTPAAVLSQSSPVEERAIVFLLVCTALVALYAATKRRKRHIGVPAGQIGGREAL